MDSNKKQTAVEWFNQQLLKRQNGSGDSRSWDEILEQAKELEKQQIKDAREDGIVSVMRADITKQIQSNSEYYTEKYGGNNG